MSGSSKKIDPTMRPLARWFSAVTDAYSKGQATWAYPGGRSLMVRVWNTAHKLFGPEGALQLVARYVQGRGIDKPK